MADVGHGKVALASIAHKFQRLPGAAVNRCLRSSNHCLALGKNILFGGLFVLSDTNLENGSRDGDLEHWPLVDLERREITCKI